VGSQGRFHGTSGLCRRAIRYRRLTPIYSIGTTRRSATVNPIFAMKPKGGEEDGPGIVGDLDRSRDGLVLLLQGTVIFTDEGADLVCHPKKLFPLFPIERDRKAPKPIYGQSTLLAHL
jgi:hypothetical protein